MLRLLQYFCFPETSNLTLEEVDWLFYEGDVVKRSRRVAKEGWEHAVGANPAVILEAGSMSSEQKDAAGNVMEKTERIAS